MTFAGPVVVRRARPADFAEIARLTVAAYEADGQLTTAAAYARVLADVPGRVDQGELYVAVDAATDQVLGAVLFVLPGTPFAELSKADEAEFRTLAVAPEAQGRGVGKVLVQACVDRARALHRSAIVISVRDFSVAAQRLYAGFGFQRWPEGDWSPLPGALLLGLRLDL